MKKILGSVMIILGIVLGLYVGLWLMFVGGIIQVASSINPLEATQIAYGILKIVLTGITGTISAYVLIIPGFILISE